MKLYSINKWDNLFENNRSKTVERLSWVPIPNRHDGESYTALISQKNGAELFAAWVLVVQVASKCQPRGRLVRGDGKPHTPESLSLKTRAPEIWFEKCLSYLEENTDWLVVEQLAGGCQAGDSQPSGGCQAGDTEGRKGIERKGRLLSIHPDSRTALHWLNEKSGKHFRECESSLAPISARLYEDGVDIDGVKKMIDRQCAKWGGSDMADYLRPATLFGKEKFEAYYASRLAPIETAKQPPVRYPGKPEGYDPNQDWKLSIA